MRMASFAKLSRPEQDRELRRLLEPSRQPPNGELTATENEIAAFEQKYQVDSGLMRKEVRSGTREESWEVCQWLMALNRRDRLVKRARPG